MIGPDNKSITAYIVINTWSITTDNTSDRIFNVQYVAYSLNSDPEPHRFLGDVGRESQK